MELPNDRPKVDTKNAPRICMNFPHAALSATEEFGATIVEQMSMQLAYGDVDRSQCDM